MKPLEHALAATSLAVVLMTACAESSPGRAQEDVPRQSQDSMASAEAFFEAIPAALAEGGPGAWMDLFEDAPDFFMASDGAVAFPDRASAETFLASFAPQVASMSLAWVEPRLEEVGGGVVVVSTGYREEIRMTDGTVSAFGGHVTGLLRRTGAGWRIQHLHWSSPPAGVDPGA